MNAMTPTVRRHDEIAMPTAGGHAAAFADAERHSRLVRRLKRGLPLAAIALILFFAAWGWVMRPPLPIAVQVDDSVLEDGKLVMVNPHLGGVNKDNERYSLTAARAIQEIARGDLIELETIAADLPVDAGNRARIVADRAVYDRGAGLMTIETPVTATTTDGTVAKLRNASVDLESGSVTTDQPVDITMRGAHITAQSMSVADHGKTIVFDRKVRLTVEPSKVRTQEGAGDRNVEE